MSEVGTWAWGEQRAWNTWEAEYPACYVHLPSGLALRVMAFSTATGKASKFPTGRGLRLLRHTTDGALAELELTHDGNDLRVSFRGHGERGMTGRLEVSHTAEWGLRFWYLLAVGFLDGGEEDAILDHLDPPGCYQQAPVARLQRNGLHAAFEPGVRPVGAALYRSWDEACQELESRGYYYRPPRLPRGGWAVYRFNATEACVDFGLGLGASPSQAQAQMPALLALSRATEPEPTDPGWHRAVADIVGWNTVWDRANQRPYTVVTRDWVGPRFGGWVVWQIDAFLHALLAAHVGDLVVARANVDAALAGVTPDGSLAALRSPLTNWVDRSHPPVGAHVIWMLYLRSGARQLLEHAYPVLLRALRWWFTHRDGNGNGLLEYGSSPVGDGHFVHSKLAAMDESANDNSPVHDQARFDLRSHTLDMEDVGLNSLLVHEMEMLARMAEQLGRPEEQREMEARAAALGQLVRAQLWDPDRGIFANRLWDGRFARSLSPASFFPMLAGIATREQADAMVNDHLLDPEDFWGPFPVAGTPHSDPAAADNVYWRGRVWPYFNYLVYQSLRRYRFDDAATELAEAGAAMFQGGWARRLSYENFDQRTGDGGTSVDAESFYTWGAILPMLAEADVIGLDPWDGVSFGRALPGRAGLWTAQAWLEAEVSDAGVQLAVAGAPVLRLDGRRRLRDLEVGADGSLSLTLPPSPDPLRLDVRLAGEEVQAILSGQGLAPVAPDGGPDSGWWALALPATASERQLRLAPLRR